MMRYVVVDSVVLSEANDWTYTFTNLPAYDENGEFTYTVEEVAYSGYTASYTTSEDGSITITKDGSPPCS